jgi:hypothetical protein
MTALLYRIAGRCPTHDRASYAVTSRLERELGMETSTPPASFTDRYSNPRLIDCGRSDCQRR